MKKKSKEVFINLALMMAAILVLFLVGEMFVRVFYDDISDYNTEMWRYASELKMKSNNQLISHIHRPNKEAELYGVDVKINSKGLRDYEYGYHKDAERITKKWLDMNIELFLKTKKMWEKYDVVNRKIGVDGTYKTQTGFGWTNAVFLALVKHELKKMK